MILIVRDERTDGTSASALDLPWNNCATMGAHERVQADGEQPRRATMTCGALDRWNSAMTANHNRHSPAPRCLAEHSGRVPRFGTERVMLLPDGTPGRLEQIGTRCAGSSCGTLAAP